MAGVLEGKLTLLVALDGCQRNTQMPLPCNMSCACSPSARYPMLALALAVDCSSIPCEAAMTKYTGAVFTGKVPPLYNML